MQELETLKLENQLCFPLYAASRAVIRHYRTLLDALDLTYTQYLAMIVLWEQAPCSAKLLGERLYLDSGTLTLVLKSLEQKGFVTRQRNPQDERVLLLALTAAGEALRQQAVAVPPEIAKCIPLEPEEAMELYRLLYKILQNN